MSDKPSLFVSGLKKVPGWDNFKPVFIGIEQTKYDVFEGILCDVCGHPTKKDVPYSFKISVCNPIGDRIFYRRLFVCMDCWKKHFHHLFKKPKKEK